MTKLYGVQFHPEVRHTEHGQEILKNFLYTVCDIAPTWTPVSIIEEAVERIRAQVGDQQVVCGLSGGVDSAVAALLVYKAVGDQLTCIFVDHGLNRKNEAEQVEATFRRHFHVPLVHVQAQERFVGKLAGVTEPEQKRKIIGEEFIRTFEDESHKLGKAKFLVQGTIYPDVIESGTKSAAVIKSHHNVGGLPDDVDFELVEPLRMLFKDEVRVVGEELGLPEDMVWRQPFPGPGLAIRIIGEVTWERLEILREADAILMEEVKRAGLYRELWQSFAVLPAIRSVGVMGDERTYAYPIVIRAVTSDDAMTADWARLPYDLLERHLAAHHQRGARSQPGGARYLQQASFDHRVGVENSSEHKKWRVDMVDEEAVVPDEGTVPDLESLEQRERPQPPADGADLELIHRRALLAATTAVDAKADEVKILDMHELVTYTDYLVLCTGRNARLTRHIAEEIGFKLKTESGILPNGSEGTAGGDWILVDYLDFVVHVFTPEAREFYRLDVLWKQAPVETVE